MRKCLSLATGSAWLRFATVPLLLAAAGCAHHASAPASVTTQHPAAAAHTAPVATPDIPPMAHLELAMELLQKGEARRAKVELEAYLDKVPDSKEAKLLLTEIETPVAKLYPKQNFSVTLGKNETLSGLAATYLGEPLAFYSLARYNDIAEPGMIIAGEQIRIPATPTALAAQSGFERAQAMAAADQAAQEQTPAQQPAENQAPANQAPGDQASADSAPPAPAPAPAPAAKQTPVDPWVQFKSALSQQRYSDAANLADANAFDPRNGRASVLADTYMRATVTEKKARAAARAHAQKAGDIFLRILKQPGKAREAFQLALSLNPSSAAARAGLKEANAELAEQYYRRGVIALQHQDLDGAIAAWNMVLSIDPNYRDAQLNRDEAIQLKANLLKVKG